MLEDDLYVTLQRQTLLLLLCQQKDYAVFLLAVLLLGWIGEGLADVQAATAVDIEEGHAASARNVRHLHELDPSQSLRSW